MEKRHFIGYWNLRCDNPEITFSVPKPGENKKLVLITVEDVPNQNQHSLGKLNSSIRKLDSGLKKLTNSASKLKLK